MVVDSLVELQRHIHNYVDFHKGVFLDRSQVAPLFYGLFDSVVRFSRGTGFIIRHDNDRSVFVSAGHCLDMSDCENSVRFVHLPGNEQVQLLRSLQIPPFIRLSSHEYRDLFVSLFPNSTSSLEKYLMDPAIFSHALLPRLGDLCFTIGYPVAYLKSHRLRGPVLSAGVIKGFSLYEQHVVHTARVEPGCSGSPLFNIRGEVIGINTHKLIPKSKVAQYDDVESSKEVDTACSLAETMTGFKV